MFKWLQRGLTSFHDNLKLGQQMKAMEGFIDLHPNATEEEKLAEASRIKAESDRRVGPFINPELRAKFDRQEPPEPEKKVQFFNTIAEEVNQVFIKHGRHLSELPGGANFNSVFALCGILRSWLANLDVSGQAVPLS